MEVKNGASLYRVGKLVADNGKYRIYICTQGSADGQCLLQVATSAEHNGDLDRSAYILKELEGKSDRLEAEFAKVKPDPNLFLNHDLGFPKVVDSFTCVEQGNRRINILAFRCVEDVSRMVPLDTLTTKDHFRVDLRTSAWIMGKSLKLLTFAHGEGIAVGMMMGNILIEPNEHYVVIFDWSEAKTAATGELPAVDKRKDIAEAAQAVFAAIGGNLEDGSVPDVDDTTQAYVDHLLLLTRGGTSDAEMAHCQFYELVDATWPREFYPFTTMPIGN